MGLTVQPVSKSNVWGEESGMWHASAEWTGRILRRQVKRKILIIGRCSWYLYYFESMWSVLPVSHCNEFECIKTFTAMLVHIEVIAIGDTSSSSVSIKKEKDNCAWGWKTGQYSSLLRCHYVCRKPHCGLIS